MLIQLVIAQHFAQPAVLYIAICAHIFMDKLLEFLIANDSWLFLAEVVLRCVIAFVVVVIALRLTGKRGVRQLSLFEVVIILTLGSAAGDVAFYKDVGVLTVVVTIITIVSLYRLITFLLLKSRAFSRLLEGEPVTIIENGRFTSAVVKNENISFDEFFMELRLCGVEHLGQVRMAILEVNGEVSIYRNEREEIIPGMDIMPDCIKTLYLQIPEDGLYSCVHCGNTLLQKATSTPQCASCGGTKWANGSSRGCVIQDEHQDSDS